MTEHPAGDAGGDADPEADAGASAEADAGPAADAALQQALEEHGVADPRGVLRDRLRALRGTAHFERAVAHYRDVLVPGVADGTLDPLEAWLEYARLVAGCVPGREVAIDADGRDGADASAAASLLLHIPEERGAPVTPLRAPAAPSAAQSATVALLVEGRTRLP
ncbi:MAG TPA: hypothetical protein VK837_02925 [Longimicrobiales bacterium]|nr:hypothetical protein [Longimicrobiales bacterium]